MKFWQAALLSLLVAMCVGGLLRIYVPWASQGFCFLIGFLITGIAYAFVKGEKE